MKGTSGFCLFDTTDNSKSVKTSSWLPASHHHLPESSMNIKIDHVYLLESEPQGGRERLAAHTSSTLTHEKYSLVHTHSTLNMPNLVR